MLAGAVKYGALCSDEGLIELDWISENGEIRVVWVEDGPPCTRDDASSGFGERMIAMTMKSDLGGTIERDWQPLGLTATLRFPVENCGEA